MKTRWDSWIFPGLLPGSISSISYGEDVFSLCWATFFFLGGLRSRKLTIHSFSGRVVGWLVGDFLRLPTPARKVDDKQGNISAAEDVCTSLQGTNISRLGKRKIILKSAVGGDM